jgi:hypothetical protein
MYKGNIFQIEVIKSKVQEIKYTMWQEELVNSMHLEYLCH